MQKLTDIIKSIFKKEKIAEPDRPEYSFCETVTATATSPWHIRKLTEKGKKLGGGADSLALCGIMVSWDLKTDIDEIHLKHACKKCVERLNSYLEHQ